MKTQHVLSSACFSREFAHHRYTTTQTCDPNDERPEQGGTKTTRAAALLARSALADPARVSTKAHESKHHASNSFNLPGTLRFNPSTYFFIVSSRYLNKLIYCFCVMCIVDVIDKWIGDEW